MRMSRFIHTFTRLLSCMTLGLGIGVAAIAVSYDSYWNRTIFKLQTVQFNILHHTLPTRLSHLLIQKDWEEIQETLDSNYDLFDLVITDPEGEKIIAKSGSNNMLHSWDSIRENSRYDRLLDPPPVKSEWKYEELNSLEPIPTGKANEGEVIGRVYYVRNMPPSFREELREFFRNPFNGSKQLALYQISMVAGVGIGFVLWILIEFYFYLKRVKDRENEEIQRILRDREDEIERQKKAIDRLNEEIERLSEEMGKHPLNSFEQEIKDTLIRAFGEDSVLVQFDVANPGEESRTPDFIVGMENCVVIIEAKGNSGGLITASDPRNEPWVHQKNPEDTREVHASGGTNPYKQVLQYYYGLKYRSISLLKQKLPPIYELVVFPSDTKIDPKITQEINGEKSHVKILNLNDMIKQLENINSNASNNSNISGKQLIEKLRSNQ